METPSTSSINEHRETLLRGMAQVSMSSDEKDNSLEQP